MPPWTSRISASGLIQLKPRRFSDARGYFVETYNENDFRAAGIATTFVQDNQSLFGRARHGPRPAFPVAARAQAKLVRVLQGSVFDVAVDLRLGSPTYGRWTARQLTAEGGEQLFVPRGFAHGFCTLEPDTEVAYKVDAFYAPASDSGSSGTIRRSRSTGRSRPSEAVLSDKDRKLGRFADFESPFSYEGA